MVREGDRPQTRKSTAVGGLYWSSTTAVIGNGRNTIAVQDIGEVELLDGKGDTTTAPYTMEL
jgi:hypothetical protein